RSTPHASQPRGRTWCSSWNGLPRPAFDGFGPTFFFVGCARSLRSLAHHSLLAGRRPARMVRGAKGPSLLEKPRLKRPLTRLRLVRGTITTPPPRTATAQHRLHTGRRSPPALVSLAPSPFIRQG